VWSKTRDRVSNFNVPRLAAPWEHEVSEKGAIIDSDTVRDFERGRQRRRLFINGAFQWCITAAICAALFAVLWTYSRRLTMTRTQKHAFNAIVTGLSIVLGLNLASSLSGYAQMMRWRLLAAKYRNLQTFGLILNCDSQTKVLRLLWAGRTQSRPWIPNKTQILCFTWLLVNIALQVLTALLGLTYSVDTSTTHILNQWGNVSIVDLSYIHNPNYNFTDLNDQAGTANVFGIQGQNYDGYKDVSVADQIYASTYYANDQQSMYWYRFQDRNPSDYSEIKVTDRIVTTTASCEEFTVVSGGYANTDEYVVYYDRNKNEDVTVWVPEAATGCGTWISNSDKTCGPRCTTTMVLLSADNITDSVPEPLFFSCTNTVGTVTNTDEYSEPAKYQMADEQVRIWAGAIGFSGLHYTGSNLQYVLYEYASDWSPSGKAEATDIARLMMRFTAAAIAADDTNGPRIDVPGYYPVQAQIVDVEWKWAIALLGGIPGVQFLVLLAVIVWANKVIIKDTSHLATARLLQPVVEKLGNKGCLLTGDEIADVLGNYRLKYGVREPSQNSVAYGGLGGEVIRHVDVIEEAEGLGRADARMANGLYDGMSTWDTNDDERELLLR
jgi:hypothetical protein